MKAIVIVLMAVLLSACATSLEQLEAEARVTGDWTEYDKELEKQIERQEMVEVWRQRQLECQQSRECSIACFDMRMSDPQPGDSTIGSMQRRQLGCPN